MGMTEMLRLVITADADDAVKKLNKLSGVSDKAAKAAEESGKKHVQFERALRGVSLMAGGVAAVALGKLAGASVQAASDLQETSTKTKVVFGAAAKEIDKFAKSAAQGLGLSERAAKDAASTYALFGKSAGLAGKDLTRFSTDLTGLSADFASFFNTSPEDAITAIGAALRGEQEPIRRYGVLLSDASVKARALSMGIYDGNGALTAQQRVLAVQAEILAQSSDAQGDFARTSDGLANQQRIMAAEFENAKAALGDGLLPIMAKATKIAGDAVGAFNGLPGPLKSTALGIAGVTVAAGIVVPWIAKIKTSLGELGITAGGTAGKLGTLAKIAGPTAIALAALPPVLDQIAKVGSFGEVSIDKMTAALIRLNTKGKPTGELVKAFGKDFTDLADRIEYASQDGAWEFFAERLTSSEGYVRDSAAAFTGLDAALQAMDPSQAAATFEVLAGAAEKQGASIKDLKALLPGYTGQIELAAEALPGAADATGDLASATGDLNGELDGTIEKFTLLNGGVIDLNRAEMAAAAGREKVTAAFKESGGALGDLNEKQRAAKDALIDQAEGIESVRAAMELQKVPAEQIAARTANLRQEMIDAAVAAGGNREAVTALTDSILKIPTSAATVVSVETQEAERKIAALRASWDRFKAAFSGAPAAILPSGANVPPRAVGGPVTAGMPYLVGERGPELFVPNSSGGIVPNGALSTSRATAGSTTNVSVYVGGSVVSERDLVRAVRDGMVDLARRGDTVAA